MGRRSMDYVCYQPPPNVEDLTFQNSVWWARYPTSQHGLRSLSPQAIRAYFADNTLSWHLGNRIAMAGDILRGPDHD